MSEGIKDVRRSEEPHDRLTRLANSLLDHIPPDDHDVGVIVLCTDENGGGLGASGHKDDAEAIAAMFFHLKAIFAANGQDLILQGLTKKQGWG